MNCTDPDCPCMEHKTPETHVACCYLHRTPLERGEGGFGFCDVRIWSGPGRTKYAHPHGSQDLRGAAWLPRALFNASDLPSEPEAAS